MEIHTSKLVQTVEMVNPLREQLDGQFKLKQKTNKWTSKESTR